MTSTILHGNALDVLRTMPEASVLSRSDSVQLARCGVVGFHHRNVVIRKGLVGYTATRAVRVREIPVSSDLRSMLSSVRPQATEGQAVFRLGGLDAEKWQQQRKDSFGGAIGCLPTKQRPVTGAVGSLLTPHPASERIAQEDQRSLVDHPYLNRAGVRRIHPAGQMSVRFGFLHKDAAFAVDQASAVRDVRVLHRSDFIAQIRRGVVHFGGFADSPRQLSRSSKDVAQQFSSHGGHESALLNWSLRDYGVSSSVWGGDASCRHNWADSEFCLAGCGAWVGCLGLEPTPALYVEHIADVFDEVFRVLRKDGTCWINLGDCYAAGGRGGDTGGASTLHGSRRHQGESKAAGQRIGSRSSFRRDRLPRGDVAHKVAPRIKPKDLVGIPWMVAFALRARGWYLRSDVIWSKRNPMPESTRDRPTKSHEYLFLLAKSEDYFYDAHAIREGDSGQSSGNKTRKLRGDHGGNPNLKNAHQGFSVPWKAGGGRNRRSVWSLSMKPFPGAHFATFPPKLVEPCILAGTSEHGCCSICGAPFTRIVTRGEPLQAQKAIAGADAQGEYRGKATKLYDGTGAQDPSAVKARILDGMRERITTGWKPGCRHTLRQVEPCVVLDPFAGAGTAGLVAQQLGRSFIGIELNPDYVAMAEKRIAPAEASA